MVRDTDPTARFFRKRAVSEVIDELIAEGEFDERIPTTKEARAFCGYCETMVVKRPSVAGFLERHEGPCGLPCLGGGVPVGERFHCDRCVLCRSPGIFPEGTKVP